MGQNVNENKAMTKVVIAKKQTKQNNHNFLENTIFFLQTDTKFINILIIYRKFNIHVQCTPTTMYGVMRNCMKWKTKWRLPIDVRGSSVKQSLPLLLQCIGTNLDQDLSANVLLGRLFSSSCQQCKIKLSVRCVEMSCTIVVKLFYCS